ncbi:MAG TPA: hypothetical protein VJC03_06285 [bacterium]|nr:hypothetical protein [bacterium]
MIRVKTFTTELKIFHTMEELHRIDDEVNRFLEEEKAELVSLSDSCTAESGGATIGLIRSIAYKTVK